MKLSYKKSGVDYSKIDPLKLMAQKAAKATARNLKSTGIREVAASRGESAYVLDMGSHYIASITECLGTKALVADAMRRVTRKTYYDSIAQDTLAMAINDILTVGARPVSVHAYWAVGGNDWFTDAQRMKDLVQGWEKACHKAGVSWGGGETPSLSGVVTEGVIDLAASCLGIIKPKKRLSLGDKLRAGDAIILLESSGIHSNGVTLARKIAGQLPKGYATKIPGGKMYGEALLAPTLLYTAAVEAVNKAGVDIHYMANITGHGWRKIMRHPAALTYRISEVPPVPPVLAFMQEQAGIDDAEAYGSLNMGAGYAIFVPSAQARKTEIACRKAGIRAWHAGVIEKGSKKVVIDPLGVTYDGESLKLRL